MHGVLGTRRDRGTCGGGSCCHCQSPSCGWLSQQLRKQRTPLATFQSLLPLHVEPIASLKNIVDGLISEAKADITECDFSRHFLAQVVGSGSDTGGEEWWP